MLKSKEWKSLQKTLTLSAQITQIDTIIKILTKRKQRLLKRMGIGKNGETITGTGDN
jgi:hypothetical protein